ncbi:hypothetical protein DMC47_15325 [Nostoc sp. 3335mG]|nr:hypothetical protein DMC47_15325 [Nostoc sp. 3335mG]
MLKHAEKHGFDIAELKEGIHASLDNDFLGAMRGMPKPASDEEERELVLALRDRMRLDMLMPPLTERERAEWRWEATPLRRYRYTGPKLLNDQPKLTRKQVEAAVDYIRSTYPEVPRYLRLVREHNDALGDVRGPYARYGVQRAWQDSFVMDAACEIVGEEGDIHIEPYLIWWAVDGTD